MSESKLATFRTDTDTWESFQAKAKRNGTNASALLQRYLRDYLDDKLDSRIDSPAVSRVDIESIVSEAIAKQLDDRDRVINIAIGSLRESIEAIAAKPSSEATAPVNFTRALLQKAIAVAPLMLKKSA